MQLSLLVGETNLLIFVVQGQGRMLTSKFCLNNKVLFLFKRYLFSEQFDTKLMKIGPLEVEIWLLKFEGLAIKPNLRGGAHKKGRRVPPGLKI